MVYTVARPSTGMMAAKGYVAELGRFCLVGASGVLVNLAVFQAGIMLGFELLAASAAAYLSAATSNYALNRAWTFREVAAAAPGAPPPSSSLGIAAGVAFQWARFLGASLSGLGVNLAVLYALTGWFGLGHIIGQLAGIAAGTLANFQLSRMVVFRAAKPARGLS